jgi:endonuclease G
VLGNPSGATTSTGDKNNFLMVKKQFVLSYNDEKGGANWVTWHLQKSDIGTINRGDFHVDKDLPAGFKRVTKADYNKTGFDRGHLCNSKDRTNNKTNNDATFNMTNILPQRPGNNQGPWRRLEDFSRTLARQGDEMYILAGAYGSISTIAHGKVNIPKTFWKVIVVLPKGGGDLSRINADTRAIAVCMPNRNSIRPNDWRRYVTTIRNIESKTGFNFLSELSNDVQDAIENRKDSEARNRAATNPCQ